ncbi:hypothetical protein ACYULU_14830 [Breznakiellaceae bacterium SP9]
MAHGDRRKYPVPRAGYLYQSALEARGGLRFFGAEGATAPEAYKTCYVPFLDFYTEYLQIVYHYFIHHDCFHRFLTSSAQK